METPQVNGEISYHGLQEWWFHELSDSDRDLILSTHSPSDASPASTSSLLHGSDFISSTDTTRWLTDPDSVVPDTIHISSSNTAYWLVSLARWFIGTDPEKQDLAIRITDKAWELRDKSGPSTGADDVFSRHSALGGMMGIYYRYRDNPQHFERAVECAWLQIAMQEDAMKAWLEQDAEHLAILQRDNPNYVDPTPNSLHPHAGYKRIAILLEKEKRFHEALDLVLEAQAAGWRGDWAKRIDRLRKKLRQTGLG